MKKRVAGKQIDRFCMIELEFLFDHHNQFEDCEGLEDEYSKYYQKYLLLSNYLSLLCLILLNRIGILSGWNLRIISASCLLSEPYIIIYQL